MNTDEIERFTLLAGLAITWYLFVKIGKSFPKLKRFFNPKVALSKNEKVDYIAVAVPVFCMLLTGFLFIAIISFVLESLPISQTALVTLCCFIFLSWGIWVILILRKRE